MFFFMVFLSFDTKTPVTLLAGAFLISGFFLYLRAHSLKILLFALLVKEILASTC